MNAPVGDPGGSHPSLTEQECFALLGGAGVGQVNFARHAMPTSPRLGYSLEGDDLVLRPCSSALARVLDATMVVLEVDGTDPASGAGWRVVVVGPASAGAMGDEAVVRLRSLDVTGHRLPCALVA